LTQDTLLLKPKPKPKVMDQTSRVANHDWDELSLAVLAGLRFAVRRSVGVAGCPRDGAAVDSVVTQVTIPLSFRVKSSS
jgi:hypothetical protein